MGRPDAAKALSCPDTSLGELGEVLEAHGTRMNSGLLGVGKEGALFPDRKAGVGLRAPEDEDPGALQGAWRAEQTRAKQRELYSESGTPTTPYDTK